MSDENVLKVQYTNVFERNRTARETTVVNVGSAGSSKSYSLLQLAIAECLEHKGIDYLITRKTMPALRMTTMRDFFDLLKEYNLYNSDDHSKSENHYTLNGNRVQFMSLDDPEKVKSSKFTKILMEEANEFSWDDYLIFLTRLRGKAAPGVVRQVRLALNPSDASGWIPKKLLQMKGVHLIHSTYKDNPFNDEAYVATLENLKNLDANHYRIYALGQWGVLKGRIYKRFDFPTEAEWPKSFPDRVFGVDFGFNDPSCVLDLGIDYDKREVWVSELVYARGLTTGTLIQRLNSLVSDRLRAFPFRCDSAEPDRIKEMQDAGYNAQPVEKGPGSVKAGIDYCLGWTIHIHPEAVNVKKEIESYSWRLDKNDEPMDEPIGFNDHAMSGLRYGLTHFRKDSSTCGVEGIKTGSVKNDTDAYEKALALASGETSFEEGLI